METTYRKVKPREEIEAWLAEHDWQEHQGASSNPCSTGVFNKDMFLLCGEYLKMTPMSSKYNLFKEYQYMDTTNSYGWLEDWLEPEHRTEEDCEIQQ